MRYFASSRFHISQLAPGLKLVLSLYMLTVLLGLGFSAAKFVHPTTPRGTSSASRS